MNNQADTFDMVIQQCANDCADKFIEMMAEKFKKKLTERLKGCLNSTQSKKKRKEPPCRNDPDDYSDSDAEERCVGNRSYDMDDDMDDDMDQETEDIEDQETEDTVEKRKEERKEETDQKYGYIVLHPVVRTNLWELTSIRVNTSSECTENRIKGYICRELTANCHKTKLAIREELRKHYSNDEKGEFIKDETKLYFPRKRDQTYAVNVVKDMIKNI